MSSYKELQEVLKDYQTRSNRSVKENAAAGLVVIWVTSRPTEDSNLPFSSVNCFYLITGILFLSALLLDLIHHFVGSVMTNNLIQKIYGDYENNQKERDKKNFDFPDRIMQTLWRIYWSKFLATVLAAVFLLLALFSSR